MYPERLKRIAKVTNHTELIEKLDNLMQAVRRVEAQHNYIENRLLTLEESKDTYKRQLEALLFLHGLQ